MNHLVKIFNIKNLNVMAKLVFVIFFCVVTLVFGFGGQKKAIKFDKFEICEKGPQAPFNVSYMNLKSGSYGSIVESKIEIFRDVLAIWGIAKLVRCNHKELLDSCEYFATIQIKELCAFIAQKNSIMAPIFYSFKPPYICPFRKGIYLQTNGTFDPNLLSVFPLGNFYWKVELIVHEKGSDLFLYDLCIEGKVFVYRE